jgi:hypothetical protein
MDGDFLTIPPAIDHHRNLLLKGQTNSSKKSTNQCNQWEKDIIMTVFQPFLWFSMNVLRRPPDTLL